MTHEAYPYRRAVKGSGARVGFAIALIVLTVAALLTWNLYDDYGQTLEQEYRTLESQARIGDANLAGALRSMDLVLQSAIDDMLASPKLNAQIIQQRQQSLLRQFPEMQALITVDSNGKVLTAESLLDPEGMKAVRMLDVSKREYFTVHRDAKSERFYQSEISRPFRSINNTQRISVSKAMRGPHGQFQGVVLVSLSPKYFEDVLQQVLANDVLDAAAIHNRLGDVIYRLPNPEKYSGKNIADGDAFKAYLRSNEQLTRYFGVTKTDNVKRILVFSKVGNTILDIGVSGQFDVVLARWYSSLWLKLCFFISVTALSVALGRQIQKRLLERRRADEQLRLAHDQLEMRVVERTQELNDAMERLLSSQDALAESEARATLSTLIASVTHELSTPFGNSLLTASSLSEQSKEFQTLVTSGEIRRADFNKFVDAMCSGSDLLMRTLGQMQELFKHLKQVAADQASEQQRSFDLANEVQAILATLTPSLKNSPHRVVVDIAPGIVMNSRPGPLGQVLINLVNNAYIHAFDGRHEGGVVTICGTADATQVRISVADNGVGLPEESLKKLFDPFFSTKIGQGGTGLGMAIVKNLVGKALGGEIHVESVVGIGTKFDILLPVALSSDSLNH